MAFALGFQNRLEIILFGNADGRLHFKQNTVCSGPEASRESRLFPLFSDHLLIFGHVPEDNKFLVFKQLLAIVEPFVNGFA